MLRYIKGMSTAALVAFIFLLSVSSPSWGEETGGPSIGSITAIEGEVYLYHKGEKGGTLEEIQAVLGDIIYLYDHILTEKGGRAQILFEDESLLNLAEKTYIQITEHIYSPEKNRRSSLFRIMMGKVRAIVGRYFRGAGSRFNVTTPTAIIGVRGTHFIVDATRVDETTVVCVDSARDLSVRNIQQDVGGEVALTSGLMTRILERQPPTPPAPVPDDQMMQLLMDTRVLLPTLHGGPVEMRGLLRRRAAAAGPEVVGGGKIPPIPEAPDQPLFTPLRIPRFPPPPPPPPN